MNSKKRILNRFLEMKSSARRRSQIRVVVAGDRSTGKSSLVAAAVAESLPETVPSVFPPTRLPVDAFPDRVPVTIIDTSASLENRGKLIEELKKADAVVLTYACDQPLTLSRLSGFWLEELRRLELKVPIIVAGCKLDLRDENHDGSLEQVMGPIMQRYREIETCIECSALTLMQVADVFYYAQKAVLHPTAPLFDQEKQTLQPRFVRALKRIFNLCDQDMDGALKDSELNDFQVNCFNVALQPTELAGVKRVVQEKRREGVNDVGLTLDGFLFLHELFIDRGRLETAWAVLRKFGYDDDLKLEDDLLPVPSKQSPDQSIELTIEAVKFLRGVFWAFAASNSGALRPADLDEIFSTAPESPWVESPYKNAVERNSMGNLTLNGFLSLWEMMTMLNPRDSLANLIYIGYPGNPASALHVTRRRSVDRIKMQTDRNVFLCLVFGPRNAGKSALLDSFLERAFLEYNKTSSEPLYAVNIIDQLGGNSRTLILHEVPDDDFNKFIATKDALAACDVAVFVYDRSDRSSWKRASDMLYALARHGEKSSFVVPCLLVAAKDDLDTYPTAVQESTKVCHELGIEAPIYVSSKLGELNNLFFRILRAAQSPHLGVPETETCRRKKHLNNLLSSSLLFLSVGAAFAVLGLAASRTYLTKRNTSS